jgi:hypothetical protein
LSGTNNFVLTITNTNVSKYDLNLSNITITNNGITDSITETIVCDTGEIDYSLSGSNIVVEFSSLIITATSLHPVGDFV